MDMVDNNNIEYNDDVVERAPARTFLGLRTDAVIELFFAFLILALIDKFACDSSGFLSYEWLAVNPYLIFALFFAFQYGSLTGMLAAIIASFLFFFGNTVVSFSDLNRLEVVSIPIFWIAVSGFLGFIRDRHIRERRRYESKLGDSIFVSVSPSGVSGSAWCQRWKACGG